MDETFTGREPRYDLTDLGLLDTSPEREFNVITRAATMLLHADKSIFFVLDAASGAFLVRSVFGRDQSCSPPDEIVAEGSLCQTVMETNRALALCDTAASPEWARSSEMNLFRLMAFLGVPVHGILGEPVGVLAAMSRTPRDWTGGDTSDLQDFAFLLQRNILLRAALQTAKRISHERDELRRADRFRN